MKSNNPDFDAVVIGSGPNGLAAAILLKQYGLSVMLLEAKNKIGGGLSTEEITKPGFLHDIAAAAHPMAAASPYLQSLPLADFGLEFINPDFHVAHPFDDGSSAYVSTSVAETAEQFGADKENYMKLMGPIVESWPMIGPELLGPLSIPDHFSQLLRFGMKAMLPVTTLMNQFKDERFKGLFGGLATHNFGQLDKLATSAIPLVMLANAHIKGWPVVKGGSARLGEAMEGYFLSLGGQIKTNAEITNVKQLPSSKTYIFDLTPKQLLKIEGNKFSSLYKWQLSNYRYGPGVFKMDWALEDPIPFTALQCRKAGTVHLGNSFGEIVNGEKQLAAGHTRTKPFVLVTQASVFDPTRAPAGKHTAYAYCHVPNGSTQDMTVAIENQMERFAPGFKKLIIGRHSMNTNDLQKFNSNIVGGDINSGSIDIGQLFTRPTLRFPPYKTSVKGWYICSAASPPGSGVHGMCGYHAARTALKDIFGVTVSNNIE